MDKNIPTQPQGEEKNGKLWLVIFILIVLVCIVLFAMGKTTNAPQTPTTGFVENKGEADNTASIEQQLKGIDLGDVSSDMKTIDQTVDSVK